MQMVWELYDRNGDVCDLVSASDETFIKELCEENGWTYKAIREDKSFIIPETPNPTTLTNEKIKALDTRQDFIEDCIAEMAMQVYEEE